MTACFVHSKVRPQTRSDDVKSELSGFFSINILAMYISPACNTWYLFLEAMGSSGLKFCNVF